MCQSTPCLAFIGLSFSKWFPWGSQQLLPPENCDLLISFSIMDLKTWLAFSLVSCLCFVRCEKGRTYSKHLHVNLKTGNNWFLNCVTIDTIHVCGGIQIYTIDIWLNEEFLKTSTKMIKLRNHQNLVSRKFGNIKPNASCSNASRPNIPLNITLNISSVLNG